MFGVTTNGVAAPRPAPPVPAPCTACQNKAGEIAYKSDRIRTLEREKAELLERITDLQARANETPATPREVAELRERMHLNARDAADTRATLAAVRNDLQDALGRRDSATRTAENLLTRLRNAGLEPAAAPVATKVTW